MRIICPLSGAILLLLGGCEAGTDDERVMMPHAELLQQAALVAPPTSDVEPLPPMRMFGDSPDITVYGFWPYWGDSLNTVPWDQMTHVAIFDVELNADGTLGQTAHWHDNAAEAVALAAPYGVKVHLCITAFSDSVMSAVLNSPSLRADVIDELRDLVDTYGADGVNVDFEGLDVDLKTEFVSFVQELSSVVDEVYVDTPPIDWSGSYDYDELAFASDGLFIMGYNYHWSGGDPGPNAPLYDSATWGSYGLDWSVNDHITWGAPADSLVLGLPLYGYDWPTTNNNVPGSATGDAVAQAYSTAVDDGIAYGRNWDAGSDTPYTFPDSVSQLWYDDDESLSAKIAYAVDAGIQGVGFWALTYDDADPDLWAAIDAETHLGADPGFTLSAPSPGTAATSNSFALSGATPGSMLLVVQSQTAGTTAIPGCGVDFDLSTFRILGRVTANASGNATLTRYVRGMFSGKTIIYQALDRDSCSVSASITHSYP